MTGPGNPNPVAAVREALAAAGLEDTVRTFPAGVPTAVAAAAALGCDLAAITNSLVFEVDGGVAPVGHPNTIRTVLDISLGAHPLLWAGAGDHHSMFSISYADLRRITNAAELQVR